MTDAPTMLALGEDYPELRGSVRRICERYPGAYWRRLEAEQAYPSEFITELTQGGFLASLIPEEYGGSGLPLRAAAVILEEIKMEADSPDYLVHEIFSSNFWKDHPLGKPILGTRETVKRFDRKMVHGYYSSVYAPANMIITAAGNLTHERLVALAAEQHDHRRRVCAQELAGLGEPELQVEALQHRLDRVGVEQHLLVQRQAGVGVFGQPGSRGLGPLGRRADQLAGVTVEVRAADAAIGGNRHVNDEAQSFLTLGEAGQVRREALGEHREDLRGGVYGGGVGTCVHIER